VCGAQSIGTAVGRDRVGNCADGCVVGVVIFSRGWGSTVWTEALLTYITPVVLSTEFALDGGAR